NCHIHTGSVLTNMMLADGVTVREHCVMIDSRIREGAVVGPFSRLRPGADIGPNAQVGNFVEVKKSRLAAGAKAQHLSYLGDALIGAGTNIGAGTITCNYDGVKKNRTVIGAQVFIGSNTALVAPVRVGDRAYVAAGSTITENVPADALGIARGKQANKPGWAAARRREMTPKSGTNRKRVSRKGAKGMARRKG
ncbi:MAG TPA: DapH/DapD/GlmU-related protein, partial [Candidatus Binatia bacterium]|nr:DapH/DapD/GlmU-related protein [Candidatus Binatia bacterium]